MRCESDWNKALNDNQKKLLSKNGDVNWKWKKLRQYVKENEKFLKYITSDFKNMFENWKPQSEEQKAETISSSEDRDKVKSTIMQLVREWSQLGKSERDACFELFTPFQLIQSI